MGTEGNIITIIAKNFNRVEIIVTRKCSEKIILVQQLLLKMFLNKLISPISHLLLKTQGHLFPIYAIVALSICIFIVRL